MYIGEESSVCDVPRSKAIIRVSNMMNHSKSLSSESGVVVSFLYVVALAERAEHKYLNDALSSQAILR